jgi:hypothetical protein
MNSDIIARLFVMFMGAGVLEDVAKAFVCTLGIDQSDFFTFHWQYCKTDQMPESHHLMSQALYVLRIISGMLCGERPNKILLNLLNSHEQSHDFSKSRYFHLLMDLRKTITEQEKEDKRRYRFVDNSRRFQLVYNELDPKDVDRRDWDLMIQMLSQFFERKIPTNPFDRQGEDWHNPRKVFWLVYMVMLLTTSGRDVLKMAEASSLIELRRLMDEYVDDGFLEEFSIIIANSGDAVDSCDFGKFETVSQQHIQLGSRLHPCSSAPFLQRADASKAAASDSFAFIYQSHLKPNFLFEIQERFFSTRIPEFVVVCLLKLIAQVNQSEFFMGTWRFDSENQRGTNGLLSLALFCFETLTSMIQNFATGEPNRFLLILLQAYAEVESCRGSDEEKLVILQKWRDIFQSTYDGMVHSSDSDKNDWDIHIQNLSGFFGRDIPSNPLQAANHKDAFWLIELALILSGDGFDIAKMAEVSSWSDLRAAMNRYKHTRPAKVFLQQFQAIIEKTGPKSASGFDDDNDDSSDDDSSDDDSSDDDSSDDGYEKFRATTRDLFSVLIRR